MTLVLTTLLALPSATANGKPRPVVKTSSATTGAPIAGRYAIRILDARDKTRRCQRALGLDPSPVSGRPVLGAAYARWVLALWRGRAQAYCTMARELGHPVGAIRAVFGEHADQALAVARCESGRSRSPRARNGQYLGMFQMGASERARYGHGSTPLEQAVAAGPFEHDPMCRTLSGWPDQREKGCDCSVARNAQALAALALLEQLAEAAEMIPRRQHPTDGNAMDERRGRRDHRERP